MLKQFETDLYALGEHNDSKVYTTRTLLERYTAEEISNGDINYYKFDKPYYLRLSTYDYLVIDTEGVHYDIIKEDPFEKGVFEHIVTDRLDTLKNFLKELGV